MYPPLQCFFGFYGLIDTVKHACQANGNVAHGNDKANGNKNIKIAFFQPGNCTKRNVLIFYKAKTDYRHVIHAKHHDRICNNVKQPLHTGWHSIIQQRKLGVLFFVKAIPDSQKSNRAL